MRHCVNEKDRLATHAAMLYLEKSKLCVAPGKKQRLKRRDKKEGHHTN